MAESSPDKIDKQILVQRFMRMGLNQLHVLGYSVAGEETVCQIPELNVCFDIGRCPYFALTSDIVCLTHAHMDHVAGIPYYLSQRYFQGMKPGTVLLPQELAPAVDRLLRCWRDVERQGTPYKLIPMAPGQTHEVRRDFIIRAAATHHGGPSLGYALISVREKLKQEFMGRPGPELAALKKSGVEIQYRVEVPLVTFLGDTAAGSVFDQPDVVNAEILLTEITFFEPDHKLKAKHGRHLHVDHFVELLPKLNNQHIVVTHVSRRTGIRKARHLLRKRVGDEQMKRIHFLMDFDDAREGGEVEDLGPPPAENAE
jgi:ribonuclease Z